MLTANNWKEYEILDSGDGAKLERWGSKPESFVVSRPDPQILWPKERPELWDKADGIYTRSKAGVNGWKFQRELPEKLEIKYENLKFWIRPTDFKHMGLFPEQAPNWDWLRATIAASIGQARRSLDTHAPKILNLFAYTGGATIACVSAGADVTHVDSARGMIEWTKENLTLNNLRESNVRFIVDDVPKFVARENRRGVRYDAIIMDPPSYGRGTKGETWKIEKMLWPLVRSCCDLLSDKPLFLLINSYSTGLDATVISNIIDSALGNRNGKITAHEIALPIAGSHKSLPAGVCGRWESGN